jgi:hypothetical protein
MFCPTCGRQNQSERKFCSGCGTNLETVSKALSGDSEGLLRTFDAALDRFIARYAERVFKDAPSGAGETGVAKSWRILGEGFVTSLVDLLLISIIWNVLPLRFLMLIVTTPFRLISRGSTGQRVPSGDSSVASRIADLDDTARNRWLTGARPSVTENTTDIFSGYQQAKTEPQEMENRSKRE